MSQLTKPVYIIGHRNPDTDSICSAIAYANLKQAQGENAIPARTGKINAETKYVLECLHIPAPKLINDLYPKVKDIMTVGHITVSPNDTLKDIGQVMKQHNVKSVPVIGAGGLLAGIVTVGDLAKLYFDELEMQDLSRAEVDFEKILKVLDGALVNGDNLNRKVTGHVRIAAGSSETINKIVKVDDVVLIADRKQAQMACLARRIACLVITSNADIDGDVMHAAQRMNAVIIKSPYDTYTCARLVNQSIPVSMIMKTDVISFKPGDLVSDIRELIAATKYRNYPVVENGRLVGLVNRDRLIIPERERVILVDHNERAQAVEGIEEAQIIEIIDHHRLGGLETSEPIFIRHEPVGSTATIIANMHWRRGVEISRDIAGLLLAAIVSDTVLFKSPTATGKDRETAQKLARIAGLDVTDFGMAVLKAGANFDDMAAADIIHNDLKEFQVGEYRLAVAQISVMDTGGLLARRADLLATMKTMRLKEGFDMVLLMVTDIINEGTHLIFDGCPQFLIQRAFGQNSPDGVIYLPKVMSRKKQVVPPLVEAVRD